MKDLEQFTEYAAKHTEHLRDTLKEYIAAVDEKDFSPTAFIKTLGVGILELTHAFGHSKGEVEGALTAVETIVNTWLEVMKHTAKYNPDGERMFPKEEINKLEAVATMLQHARRMREGQYDA